MPKTSFRKNSGTFKYIDAVAKNLKISGDQIAVVSLAPRNFYNVEEGLIPTILQQLDRAKDIRFTQYLRDYHQDDYWLRLWTQSKNAGRFIAKKVLKCSRRKRFSASRFRRLARETLGFGH